jgi:hypothetical protein
VKNIIVNNKIQNKMKQSLFYVTGLFVISLSITSCGNSSSKKAESKTTSETVVTTLNVDDLLSKADSYVGKSITFDGVCTHTCKHGGKKIFMMGSDDTKTIRVDASKEIGSFPSEVVNSMVEVTGVLVEERIDESVIRRMEEQYVRQTAEKHGDDEVAGCATEKNAHGQKELNSFEQRMQNYRERIAARNEKEGKAYLSFYAVKGESYKVK